MGTTIKNVGLALLIAGTLSEASVGGPAEPPAERAERTDIWSASTSVMLPSAEGSVQATVRQTQLRYTLRGDPSKLLPMAVVVIPSRRLYWVALDEKCTYFVLKDRLVGLRGGRDSLLALFPSSDHLDSPGDEEPIGKKLDDRVAKLASEDLEYKAVVIELDKYLGLFPFMKHGDARGEPAPTVEDVSVEEDRFSVRLSGGEGNKVKAVITLANDFTVTKATLDGLQVYPK